MYIRNHDRKVGNKAQKGCLGTLWNSDGAREHLELFSKLSRTKNELQEVQKVPGSELAHDRGPGTAITMEEQTPPDEKGTYLQKVGQGAVVDTAALHTRFLPVSWARRCV